ncbi:hypothetical protein Vadar_028740 [Vaccinium darrowii]|uniref:Uncharacterized protein n=1 Tax=Vaccinium darrowii TaxID=229202 RepID=A0ACB7XCW4_9ERIC|nr:hypothetical protein Vadar_028740 [Vaccinium darrowii]
MFCYKAKTVLLPPRTSAHSLPLSSAVCPPIRQPITVHRSQHGFINNNPNLSKKKKKTITLKLLVDTKSNKVVYAEAKKDFVDFLFGLLELPIGTVLSLLINRGMSGSGSLGKIHESVKTLDQEYLQSDQTRKALLSPAMVDDSNKPKCLKEAFEARSNVTAAECWIDWSGKPDFNPRWFGLRSDCVCNCNCVTIAVLSPYVIALHFDPKLQVFFKRKDSVSVSFCFTELISNCFNYTTLIPYNANCSSNIWSLQGATIDLVQVYSQW